MELHPTTVSAAVLLLTLTLFLSPTTTKAHNITHILAGFPDFSTFSHYLTVTHLADDINSRETITVCAVDNAAMSDLLSKNLPLSSIKNVLSLHVLLDYFGSKKLHQITNGTALAATLYQATGSAPGSSGFVNITDQKAGKVALGAVDSGLLDASYVKSLMEIPYNISVIQISKVFTSPDAAAPTPSPSQVNLTSVMSAHGCKVFAETLLGNPALTTFTGTVSGGLTIFCPGDDAMKNYLPKFKNLTADKKQSLLEYHGIPVYMSFSQLKSNNGPINTLATDGNNKYNFVIQNDGPAVTLKTKVVNAKILSTLKDEDPLAIFVVDKVLIPPELSNTTLAPTPSPAPAPGPASSKHKSPPAPPTSPADSPADGPASSDAADQTGNDAVRYSGVNFIAVGLSFGLAYLVM